MGFELQKAFQMETRRLLWLIGLVFATIVLFQCVELPKGNALWSVFSRAETPRERTRGYFNANNATSSEPILSSNKSSPSVENTRNSSLAFNEGQNTTFSLQNPQLSLPSENDTSKSNTSLALPPGQSGNFTSVIAVPPVVPPAMVLSPNEAAPNITMEVNTLSRPPRLVHVFPENPKSEMPPKEVLTLSDMKELLVKSLLSPDSMIPRWSTKADQDLVFAKSEIEKAPLLNKDGLYAPLYHNASMFQRSYELMEQMLKVYIYKEGDRRIFHRPPLEGIYASEGWFMKLLEANRHFVTRIPKEAHLFYLPFSSRMLEETLYVTGSHSHKNLIQHLKNYLDMISGKYPFWNRTDGADHFLVACHDWAPSETKRDMVNCIRALCNADVKEGFKFGKDAPSETKRDMVNCIRALCNADVKEGFKFGKDVSLPETYVRKARNPLRDVGGKPPSKRKILAFFAGNMHGYLRPILLQHWGNNNNNNDPEMQIFGTLPHSKGNRNYIDYMKSSKYCICPRGYEVNSPRVVEAIFYECVPVIISDNFVPPFLETLNWESFAVFVMEKDIPFLKNILLSIPEKTYFRMFMRVKKVQRHFLWHPKPVKYDLFHMILHSVWFNRVLQFRPR